MSVKITTGHGFVRADSPTGPVGTWTMPDAGSPTGTHADGREFADFMPWLFAVSGFPKVWIESEASGTAYFLTHDNGMLGHAPIGADGTRMVLLSGDAGIGQGLLSIPRMLVGNLIAILAVKRAIGIHTSDQPRRWEKTHHIFPAAEEQA